MQATDFGDLKHFAVDHIDCSIGCILGREREIHRGICDDCITRGNYIRKASAFLKVGLVPLSPAIVISWPSSRRHITYGSG